jgi:hypothetical protein
MKNCLIVCPMRTLLRNLIIQMNNCQICLPKLCTDLTADFLLTLSNVWPVVWQYNNDKSVQVS